MLFWVVIQLLVKGVEIKILFFGIMLQSVSIPICNYTVCCDKVNVGNYVKSLSGSIIAENTEVGDHVVFERDVMVWPNKQIEEGSIVSSNLIWGDKWKKASLRVARYQLEQMLNCLLR